MLSPDNSGLVWKDVALNLIMKELLIDKFSFSTRSRVFNEIGAFCDWMQKSLFTMRCITMRNVLLPY